MKVYALGDEPSDDLSGSTTPEQRLEMMWELSERAWLIAGGDVPDYDRTTTPGRVLQIRR